MAKATAKYVRMSSRKVRRVINEIRGKNVTQAKTLLKFMPYAASHVVAKVLNSAISNAKENENLSPTNLRVANVFVNDAPVFKRWRPMSRGRGFPILKRNSHITIEVVPLLEHEIKPAKHHHDHTEKEHTHKHEPKVDDKTNIKEKESKSEKAEKKKKSAKVEKKKSDIEKAEDKKKTVKSKKKKDEE